MRVHFIGSGSKGNCTVFENEECALIIDCGVNIRDVKKALNFNIMKVEEVLVTHIGHGDHFKYVDQFINSGMKVTHSENGIVHNKKINTKSFEILPLKIPHDVETYAFLIRHDDFGLALYASDLHYFPYKIKNLNQLIIEANYDIDILDANVSSGRCLPMLRERIINSHMSLDTVKGVMRANDLRKVNNIVLIHLSDSNSSAECFKEQITELTGKRVTIAEAGLVMDFNKEF